MAWHRPRIHPGYPG